jgi:thymidylate kinase
VTRGILIAVEGVDGGGKSEQARRLFTWLRRLPAPAPDTVLTHEPTNGPIGSVIRSYLGGSVALSPSTIPLLFAADRKDHIAKVIQPDLAIGRTVVTDRYVLSNLVYRAAEVDAPLLRCGEYDDFTCNWRGEPSDVYSGTHDLHAVIASEETGFAVEMVENIEGAILVPDLTIILSVSPDVAAGRLAQREKTRAVARDKYDIDSKRLARACWLYSHPYEVVPPSTKVAIIDGSGTMDEVELLVRAVVAPLLGGA